MDDDRRIQRIKEKSIEKRRMASLEVGTCRKAENLKKKKDLNQLYLSILFQVLCHLAGSYVHWHHSSRRSASSFSSFVCVSLSLIQSRSFCLGLPLPFRPSILPSIISVPR